MSIDRNSSDDDGGLNIKYETSSNDYPAINKILKSNQNDFNHSVTKNEKFEFVESISRKSLRSYRESSESSDVIVLSEIRRTRSNTKQGENGLNNKCN
jgi:hypothetical protein